MAWRPVRPYLITEPARGRYRFHDLIREHARALADGTRPPNGTRLGRLLDYYPHTGALAGALLGRQASTRRPAGPPAVAPACPPAQALAWARAERANLLACLDDVAGPASTPGSWRSPPPWPRCCGYDGPWADVIARHATAVRAARQPGDRLGEAKALANLGDVQRLTGDYPSAVRALEEALGIYRDLGDRLGEANALLGLGDVRSLTEDYRARPDLTGPGHLPGARRPLRRARCPEHMGLVRR